METLAHETNVGFRDTDSGILHVHDHLGGVVIQVDVDKSSQDQSTLPHSKEKTTHPAIVYFKAFPTGSSVTGSAKLCPYLRTDQIEQDLLPVIRIDIDILGT